MSLLRACLGKDITQKIETDYSYKKDQNGNLTKPVIRIVERPLAADNDMELFLSSMKRVGDFEKMAELRLPESTWQYAVGTPERGLTFTENVEAFKRVKLLPRLLRNVSPSSGGRVQTTLLGSPVDSPIGVSPTACQKWFWKDGEISTARGASLAGSCFIMSTNANTSIKELAATSNGLRWMQMIVYKKREAMETLVRLAENNGFSAIVVTVDVSGFPYTSTLVNPPAGMWTSTQMAVLQEIGAIPKDVTVGPPGAQDATWKDIDYIRGLTKLPLVVKGILTAEDARSAVLHGANAVLVSNHGGRQLDTSRATLDSLAEVVAEVGDEVEVYLDGGVRHGTDVLKALALGARAVFVGRPALWGLACGGAAGVHRVLTIIKEELDHSMCMAGCRTLKDIAPDIIHAPEMMQTLKTWPPRH